LYKILKETNTTLNPERPAVDVRGVPDPARRPGN